MRYSQYIKTARTKKVNETYTQARKEVPSFGIGSGQIYTESVFTYDENNNIQLSTDLTLVDTEGNMITVAQRPQAYHKHE